jgi:hypothetical protein
MAPNSNIAPGYQGYSNLQKSGAILPVTAAYPFAGATGAIGISGYAQQYAPQTEPEFDLSQLGTIVASNHNNRGYYSLLLSVDGDRLAYLVGTSDKYDNTVINWKTPAKMVEFLGEFDLLNQHWVDFKSKAIGYIMGKFQLDEDK